MSCRDVVAANRLRQCSVCKSSSFQTRKMFIQHLRRNPGCFGIDGVDAPAKWELVDLPALEYDIEMSNSDRNDDIGVVPPLVREIAPLVPPALSNRLDHLSLPPIVPIEHGDDALDPTTPNEDERLNEMLQRLRSGLESEALSYSGLDSVLEVALLEFHFKHFTVKQVTSWYYATTAVKNLQTIALGRTARFRL